MKRFVYRQKFDVIQKSAFSKLQTSSNLFSLSQSPILTNNKRDYNVNNKIQTNLITKQYIWKKNTYTHKLTLMRRQSRYINVKSVMIVMFESCVLLA